MSVFLQPACTERTGEQAVQSESIFFFSFEATKTIDSSHVLSKFDYCNALLADSPQILLGKIQSVINCSSRLICKAPKSAHMTLLLQSTSYQSAAGFSTKQLLPTCMLSQVPLIHTSLGCFISALLALFAQPRIVGSSMFRRLAGGPSRNLFNTSDLLSETRLVSVRHSPSLSQN